MDKEKGVVIGENRMRNDSSAIIYEQSLCDHFGLRSRVCQRAPIGVEATVHGFSPGDVRTFLNKWYRPASAKLFVVGDFDPLKLDSLVRAVLGNESAVPATRRGPPPAHAAPPSSVDAGGPAERSDVPGEATVIVSEHAGADGVSFALTSTDPAGYTAHPFTRRQRRRAVYDALFRVVYSHMVLEAAHLRYPEMGQDIPVLTVDASVNNAYELGARVHELELGVTGGFGSPHRCRSSTPPWAVELDSALLELKRLSTWGPDPELVRKAVELYAAALKRRARTSAWTDHADVVADLHDKLDPGFEYRTDEEQRADEGYAGLLHPELSSASLGDHIQAEATFLWKSLLQSANNSYPFEVGAGSVGLHPFETSLTPQRVTLSVAYQPVIQDDKSHPPAVRTWQEQDARISAEQVKSVISNVFEKSVNPPDPPTRAVKTDKRFDQQGEDSDNVRDDRRHKRFVWERKTGPTQPTIGRRSAGAPRHARRQPPSGRPLGAAAAAGGPGRGRVRLATAAVASLDAEGNGANAAEQSVVRASGGEASAAGGAGAPGGANKPTDGLFEERTGHLLDRGRLVGQATALADALAPRKGPTWTADIAATGAELVEQDPESGARRFKLLNGIPVLIKARRSGRLALPEGPPGSATLQIVSLGGRATEREFLKGACDLVNYGGDYVSGYSTHYSDTLNASNTATPEDIANTDYFSAETVGAYASAVAARMANPRGGPGEPGKVDLRCESEYMVVQVELSKACPLPLSTDRDPSLAAAASAECSTQGMQYGGIAQLLRLAMQPHYTDRTVHQMSSGEEEKRCSARRGPKPRDTMKTEGLSYILPEAVVTAGFTSARGPQAEQDHRLTRTLSSSYLNLDPALVSAWVHEQFTTDRIEINVAGDVNEKALLKSLNLALGTLPKLSAAPRQSKRVGYDVHSAADVPFFTRTWKPTPVRHRCYQHSVNPDRAFNLLVVPAAASMAARGTAMLVLAREVFERKVWASLRKDGGFSYYVDVGSTHSVLYPGYGYFHLQWSSGKYNSQAPDLLNVQGSLNAARADLAKKEVDQDTFATAKAVARSESLRRLQSCTDWLDLMRGVSLKPPAAVRGQYGATAAPSSLKDLNQLNVLDNLDKLTAASVQQFWSSYGHLSDAHKNVVLDATLVTGTTLEAAQQSLSGVKGTCLQP